MPENKESAKVLEKSAKFVGQAKKLQVHLKCPARMLNRQNLIRFPVELSFLPSQISSIVASNNFPPAWRNVRGDNCIQNLQSDDLICTTSITNAYSVHLLRTSRNILDGIAVPFCCGQSCWECRYLQIVSGVVDIKFGSARAMKRKEECMEDACFQQATFDPA